MSVAFYFDHNVRLAIALGLRRRGVDVLVARDDGFDEADDPTILAHATELDRVAFTNDDDFLAVAHQWRRKGQPFSGLIYVHQLRLTVGQTIAELEVIGKAGAGGLPESNRVPAVVIRNSDSVTQEIGLVKSDLHHHAHACLDLDCLARGGSRRG